MAISKNKALLLIKDYSRNITIYVLLYIFPCVILFLCVFSPFSIAITSLGEERANLSAFRTFVLFVLV